MYEIGTDQGPAEQLLPTTGIDPKGCQPLKGWQPCQKELYLSYMPIPEKYIADFEEEEIYHVYNRTNNKEKLGRTDENRRGCVKRYKEIIAPFTYTYC